MTVKLSLIIVLKGKKRISNISGLLKRSRTTLSTEAFAVIVSLTTVLSIILIKIEAF